MTTTKQIHTIEIAEGDSIVIMMNGKPIARVDHQRTLRWNGQTGPQIVRHELRGRTFENSNHFMDCTGSFAAGSTMRVEAIELDAIKTAMAKEQR